MLSSIGSSNKLVTGSSSKVVLPLASCEAASMNVREKDRTCWRSSLILTDSKDVIRHALVSPLESETTRITYPIVHA